MQKHTIYSPIKTKLIKSIMIDMNIGSYYDPKRNDYPSVNWTWDSIERLIILSNKDGEMIMQLSNDDLAFVTAGMKSMKKTWEEESQLQSQSLK